MVENKKEEKEESKSSENTLKSVRRNPWMASTIVLGILSILLIVFLVMGVGSGNVSKNQVEDNLNSFMESQGIEDTEIVSVEKEGSLYKANLKMQGEDVPVYITLDGKSLIPQAIPLVYGEQTNTPDSASNEPSTPVDIPKSDKPKVELFVMSHCPYGTQAEKGMLPVALLLKDKIDFQIKFVYYAMHGKTEIDEQLRQYCIQKEQNAKFISYLRCFLTDGNSESCLKSTSINTASLGRCVQTTDTKYNVTKSYENKATWLSGNYPLFDVYKEDNQKYNIGGSPTLVVNGVQVQSGRDSVSLLGAICGAFNSAPNECNTKLESTSPSAGFGWDTSSSNNLATCG